MTTIRQALEMLIDSGMHNEQWCDYETGVCKIAFEIPMGALLDQEIEGTVRSDYDKVFVYKELLNNMYGFSTSEKRETRYHIPEVRKVLYNGSATIVFWEDNTKTVVKMQPDEDHYDADKAFAMAVCKKLFGNTFNKHLTQAQKAYTISRASDNKKDR